jgi:protein subunit release factor A
VVKRSELKIETFQGQGSGGQHRNRTYSCVRITHLPTGISTTRDGRCQHQNKRKCLKEIDRLVQEHIDKQRAAVKKARRNEAIHKHDRVRTYDYSRGVVTDHRTGKTASIKDILEKGMLDKLR